jgi:hypothetical protein
MSTVRDAKKDLERHLDMEFRVMIPMPAMIVPFKRLSPKHKNNTTYRGLEATDEQLHQVLSENKGAPYNTDSLEPLSLM